MIQAGGGGMLIQALDVETHYQCYKPYGQDNSLLVQQMRVLKN